MNARKDWHARTGNVRAIPATLLENPKMGSCRQNVTKLRLGCYQPVISAGSDKLHGLSCFDESD